MLSNQLWRIYKPQHVDKTVKPFQSWCHQLLLEDVFVWSIFWILMKLFTQKDHSSLIWTYLMNKDCNKYVFKLMASTWKFSKNSGFFTLQNFYTHKKLNNTEMIFVFGNWPKSKFSLFSFLFCGFLTKKSSANEPLWPLITRPCIPRFRLIRVKFSWKLQLHFFLFWMFSQQKLSIFPNFLKNVSPLLSSI